MMSRETMKLALEALIAAYQGKDKTGQVTEAIAALREALAEQPAQHRAWFTVDELSAWADKKLKENPQWAEQPAQVDPCIDGSCSCCWANLDEQPAQQTDSYVQQVPDKCDRIVWRGSYYHLPLQPAQQEPVAWMYQCSADSSGPVLMQHKKDWAESGSGLWTETPLYTSPPAQRTWVDLTIEEIKAAYLAVSEIEWAICGMDDAVPFTRIIEAKLKEKNT